MKDDALLWRRYLGEFHTEKASITESILDQCNDEHGQTPYQWLQEQWTATPDERILDLACGSAPLWVQAPTGYVLGFDRSRSELGFAATRLNDVVAGDVTTLPFKDESIDHIVCSMALMVFAPLPQSVREITRVLRPGGQLHLLLPSRTPINLFDVTAYAGVKVALGFARFATPSTGDDTAILTELRRAGLTVEDIQRRRFAYVLNDSRAVEAFVASWYTPRSTPSQLLQAERILRKFLGRSLGVAISRWLITKPLSAPPS